MAGYVAAEYGWRSAFYVLGVPGVLLAIAIMLTIKEPARGRLDAVDDKDAPSFADTMKFIWSQKSMVHTIMGAGLSALWGWGLMWFTPTFIQRSYGLDVGEAGAVIGPIHLVMGIGASLLTAWLVGRPAYTDPRKILRLLGVITAIATMPSIYAYYTNSLSVATLMWWIFIPAIYFYIGPSMSLLQNLAPPKMRAMVIAVSLLVANVFNLIVAPQGVGLLSDYFAGPSGADAASLRLALLILAPTGFWAAWHYWRAEKYVIEDQKRAIGYV